MESLETVSASFDVILKGKGISEKEKLSKYIMHVSACTVIQRNNYYALLINVCQSSGSGKSKIASELMLDFPSVYVVLRQGGSGFPKKSSVSDLFFLEGVDLSNIKEDEEPPIAGVSIPDAKNTIVGLYTLLLRGILEDYIGLLREFLVNRSKKEALSLIYADFMKEEATTLETARLKTKYFSDKHKGSSINTIAVKCGELLEKIVNLFKKGGG